MRDTVFIYLGETSLVGAGQYIICYIPPADRGNLRIYPSLPPAVRKRRTNEAAAVCPWAAELAANVNSDCLITVSSNGRDEVMCYHCWRYITLMLICHTQQTNYLLHIKM